MHLYRARGAVIAWELSNATAPVASAVTTWRLLSRQAARTLHWWSGAAATATITGAGDIASEEAFGTATVTTGAQVTGAGDIASGEEFGTATVSGSTAAAITGAGGIASGEAFGTAFVTTGEQQDLALTLSRIGLKRIRGTPG